MGKGEWGKGEWEKGNGKRGREWEKGNGKRKVESSGIASYYYLIITIKGGKREGKGRQGFKEESGKGNIYIYLNRGGRKNGGREKAGRREGGRMREEMRKGGGRKNERGKERKRRKRTNWQSMGLEGNCLKVSVSSENSLTVQSAEPLNSLP